MNIDSLLHLISIIVWVLFASYSAYALGRGTRRFGVRKAIDRYLSFQTLIFLLAAVFVSFLSAALVFVEPQNRGVVISAVEGIEPDPRSPGVTLIWPLAQEVVQYPIFWQSYTMSSQPLEGERVGDDAIIARTDDGQEVRLDCSVIFRLNRDEVVRVHINWQNRYMEEFIRPRTRGLVRSIASQFEAIELNSARRSDLEEQINSQLEIILRDQGFELDAFVLRNVAFSPEFALAVEEKKVAEQKVLQARLEAQQIEALAAGRANQLRIEASGAADARRTRAQGEADALALINQSLSQAPQSLLTYEYIQKLSPNVRALLVPSNAPLVLPVPGAELFGTPATNNQLGPGPQSLTSPTITNPVTATNVLSNALRSLDARIGTVDEVQP